MNHIEFISALPLGVFDPNGNLEKTKFLARGGEVSILPQDYRKRDGDEVFEYSKNGGLATFDPVSISNYPNENATAEEWLVSEGFSSTRLITLLDLEVKLRAAGKASVKLSAARGWTEEVLATYVQSPVSKNDWSFAPYTFEEVTQEVSELLENNFTTLAIAPSGGPVINMGGIAKIQRVTAMPEDPDPDTLYIVIP